MTTHFPPLYKRSAASGKINCWKCSVTDDTITVEQGQVGGATQAYPTTCEGKNIGRANESSPAEQALSEAQSKWAKQIKKGYVEDTCGESCIKLPMRVSNYFGSESKVVFPCSVSPKLNGVNAEARLLPDDSIILLSRGGEEYILPEYWYEELLQTFEALETDSLNGEVYKHGEWLQDINGAMKKPNELTKQLEFHIFDLPNIGGDWKCRANILDHGRYTIDGEYIKFVSTATICDHHGIERLHNMYTSRPYGYEGIIIRNNKGLYEYNTQSNDVFKMKIPLCSEFKMVDFKIDKYCHPVFQCESKGGLFWVKPKGTDAHRKAVLSEAEKWIGKYLTVEFESYSKGGKPTKPVGIYKREGEWNEETQEFVPSE